MFHSPQDTHSYIHRINTTSLDWKEQLKAYAHTYFAFYHKIKYSISPLPLQTHHLTREDGMYTSLEKKRTLMGKELKLFINDQLQE